MDQPPDDSDALELLDELCALRSVVAAEAAPLVERWGGSADLANLAHYLRLRHRELRPMQRRLALRGLSSLGRLEGHVLPTLDATIAALSALLGRPAPYPPPSPEAFFAGEAKLAAATTALLGPPPVGRATRIMVTLPSEAADDPALVLAYVRAGMNVARINCAHDTPAMWQRMATNVRAAGETAESAVRIFMDIAGPKIRTGTISDPAARLFAGSRFHLVADATPGPSPDGLYRAALSVPAITDRLSVGDRVLYNDGKLAGVVESIASGDALIRVDHARPSGVRLKPEKGLNFPDTPLGLSPLTSKDEGDIATIVECADIIGYSFVSHPDDLDTLEALLARVDGRRPLGLVAKIERPEAIRNLPELIARALPRRPFGVMIARGDLAVEIGFERVAEMQEEILWLCEAASVPVIWATQVLESVVAEGIPSRGEMTDAAMSVRAECVMLNKGPQVGAAIEILDRLLARMDDHISKKTPMLRALHSW